MESAYPGGFTYCSELSYYLERAVNSAQKRIAPAAALRCGGRGIRTPRHPTSHRPRTSVVALPPSLPGSGLPTRAGGANLASREAKSQQPTVSGRYVMAAGRQGRKWRTLAARMREELAPVCWICGQAIDLGLNSQRDPMGWTLDHVQPVATHPHLAEEPSNLRAAHRRCNSAKGKRESGPKPKSSRRWT